MPIQLKLNSPFQVSIVKESESEFGDPVVLLFSFGTLGDRKKLDPCGSPIPEQTLTHILQYVG